MKIISKKGIAKIAVIAIVMVYAYVFISSLSLPKRVTHIETANKIDPTFNGQAKLILLGKDPNVVVNVYSAPINVNSGFGNTVPFTPGE